MNCNKKSVLYGMNSLCRQTIFAMVVINIETWIVKGNTSKSPRPLGARFPFKTTLPQFVLSDAIHTPFGKKGNRLGVYGCCPVRILGKLLGMWAEKGHETTFGICSRKPWGYFW